MLFKNFTCRSLAKRQSSASRFMALAATGYAAFVSTVIVRGLTVCGCFKALRKNRRAGSRIPLGREQEINGLPCRIHGAVQVHPFALHPDVSFVHTPRAIRGSKMRTDTLIQLRCIGLDPPDQGGVIDLHTTIGEHAL